MISFTDIDIGGLQRMIFPVIKAVGGPDLQGEIADKALAFRATADGLDQLSDLFEYCATALDDGILDNSEIEEIVEQAETMPGALEAILSAIKGSGQADD